VGLEWQAPRRIRVGYLRVRRTGNWIAHLPNRVGGGPQVRPVNPMTAFEFAAPLWRYPGEDGWYFVSLPPGISADISDITAGIRRGFGSVRVAVGTTSWRTSVFPDSKTGVYLLSGMEKLLDAYHQEES
jgi:Domain of unknown function (DUF1905)